MKKNLLKDLDFKNLKKYRTSLNNCEYKSVKLVCLKEDIEKAVDVLNNRYSHIQIEKICVYTNDKIESQYGNYKLEKLEENLNGDNFAMYINNENSFSFIDMLNFVSKNTNKLFYIFSDSDRIEHFDSPFNTQDQIKYINLILKKIKKAYNLLDDKHSKNILLCCIDTLCNGHSDRLKDESFLQYDHPKVHAKDGDYIISGGLGITLNDTKMFCQKIGKTGRVFAFEPIEQNVKIIESLLNEEPDIKKQTEVIKKGLWDKKDILYFSDNADASSSIWTEEDCSISCEVISIDEFVEENNVKKVDFIKMDIEGAEHEALKGAFNTINKFKPKMAVSIYHRPDHLIELLLYIDSLNLGYEFYMGHHSNHYEETVLYAKVPSVHSKFLRRNNFDKQIRKLQKTLKDKKVVIYKSGDLLDSVLYDYDLGLNVAAVADSEAESSKIDTYKGYKLISPSSIENIKPDVVLVCSRNYLAQLEHLRYQLLKDTNIKVLPLVKKSFISTLKEIWK